MTGAGLFDSTENVAAVEQIAEAVADRVAERLGAQDGRPLLSTKALAERLGISDRTARQLLEGPCPKIASFKVEGARRIDPAAVDRYLEGQRGRST